MSERSLQNLHNREKKHVLPNGKLASEYREAPCASFEDVSAFTTAHDWHDKPHRLIYDLLEVVDQYKRKIARLERELKAARR